jgi:hypothetical protein
LARAELVRFFLWRAGADLDRNTVRTIALGELGAQAIPEHRCVSILVVDRGQSKQQVFPATANLPSEVNP